MVKSFIDIKMTIGNATFWKDQQCETIIDAEMFRLLTLRPCSLNIFWITVHGSENTTKVIQ